MIRPLVLASMLLSTPVLAGSPPPPQLTQEHAHSSGVFTFKTPSGWQLEPVKGNKEALDAFGDNVRVRFVYHVGDMGFDIAHSTCMLERLAGSMEMRAAVSYDYDFLSGQLGPYQALDSAFVVTYDRPIGGYNEWHQRNLTLVGQQESLCLIAYAPLKLYKKKSSGVRVLLDAVLNSVNLHPPMPPAAH
jgi:hypothetical protein